MKQMKRQARSQSNMAKTQTRPVASVNASRSTVRRALHALLLLPFLIMSLIPAGTMTVNSDQGQVRIVICSGNGPVQVTLNDDGSFTRANANDQADSPQKHKSNKVCDWAPHNSLIVAPSLVSIEQLEPLEVSADLTHGFDTAHLRLAVLAPSARGPPAVA